MAGPKLSSVRSSWTQVIRLFTSWRTKLSDSSPVTSWTQYQAFHQSKVAGPKLSGCLPVRSSWTQVIRIFTSQKWLDPSYQAAYQLEVAGPKLSGFSPVKHGGPKLSDSDPKSQSKVAVRSSWTQVIRIFTSQKWLDPSYQAAYQLEVAGPKLSGFSPAWRTQVIRLFTSHNWLWTQNIRLFTSQKWQDPSYQAAYQLEVAGPKLSGFSPVKSGRTQVIRLLTS